MPSNSSFKASIAWAGGPTSVQSAYEWEPTDVLPGVPEDRMLGVEAPLWTETVVTREDIDYLAFPRLAAVAEIGWSNKENRTWADFSTRLALWDPRFTALGIAAHRDQPAEDLRPAGFLGMRP